ncbi:ABC transporter permease [Actinoplanes sp. NPDC051411]|uniref:ABC transporter permease n=1 Tax=Actinoplanes sp. NPDC051411 TaxID=3155522 RepID=UPI0034311F8E
MSQTAVADSETGLPLKELARRNGLSSAGRMPSVFEYAKQVWSYRHFIAAFARARTIATLGETRLGMIWQVLTPVFNAGVYYVIFGVIINTRRSQSNFITYLCIGVFLFGFTQTVVQNGVMAITGNLGLIRALHFPRASLPVAVTLIEIRNMVASLSVLLAIVLISGEPIRWQWLLMLPLFALQSLFNAGLALFVARLGTKVHDIRQLIPFIMRFWLYGSAVIYPVTNFTHRFHDWKIWVIKANPLLVFIELGRHALMKDVELVGPPVELWIEAIAWTVLVVVVGYLYFRRGEKGYGRG